MPEPAFTETLQVAIIVRDLDKAVRTYWDDYGIGPWSIYEFNPDTVEGMHQDGEPIDASWRLALTMVGSCMWELIEPLDDRSDYARFLAEKGEGVHHVAVGLPSFDGFVERTKAKGEKLVLGGTYNGVTFAYFPTKDDLGVVTEGFSAIPEGQEPDATYP